MAHPSIELKNFDTLTPSVIKPSRHGDLFPTCLRCIILGPSNSGKSNALLNLLLDKNGLRFEHLHIICGTLGQPKYELLRKIVTQSGVGYVESDNPSCLTVHNLRPNSVVIYDDILTKLRGEKCVQEMFAMSRHVPADVIIVSQSYISVPRTAIRENVSCIFVFAVDKQQLEHIYSEFVTDLSFNEFANMCRTVWAKAPHTFLSIFKELTVEQGKYRLYFDQFINPHDLKSINTS